MDSDDIGVQPKIPRYFTLLKQFRGFFQNMDSRKWMASTGASLVNALPKLYKSGG